MPGQVDPGQQNLKTQPGTGGNPVAPGYPLGVSGHAAARPDRYNSTESRPSRQQHPGVSQKTNTLTLLFFQQFHLTKKAAGFAEKSTGL
jgi:hypothetical protein